MHGTKYTELSIPEIFMEEFNFPFKIDGVVDETILFENNIHRAESLDCDLICCNTVQSCRLLAKVQRILLPSSPVWKRLCRSIRHAI